jgi:hypothetical protein
MKLDSLQAQITRNEVPRYQIWCGVQTKYWGGTDIPVCVRTGKNACATPIFSVDRALDDFFIHKELHTKWCPSVTVHVTASK